MTTGNQSTFELAMAQGVAAHAEGNHLEALHYRTQAFEVAEDNVEMARALRDSAASRGYLGDLDSALEDAAKSVDLLMHPADSPRRELAASQDRYGRVLARIAIKDELAGGAEPVHETGIPHFKRSWDLLRADEKAFNQATHNSVPWPFSVDQYRINMAPRYAVAEALFGDSKLKAIKIAARGVVIAALSENPLLEHSTKERMGIVKRTVVPLKDVAVAAIGLGAVAFTPNKPDGSRRRTAALRFADKWMQ